MGERQWLPPLDLEYSDDMRNELAQIVGGLSVALAQSSHVATLKFVATQARDSCSRAAIPRAE
jgi:hypothetical protein